MKKQTMLVGVLWVGLATIGCGRRPPSDRVSMEVARAEALRLVPGGRITGEELEKEDGHWIYSFDVAVEGRAGVQELHVDALTGKLLEAGEGAEEDEGH